MLTGAGSLPRHIYCFVDCSAIRRNRIGFEPCVWFGVSSTPGRMWGCHVMLECGAIYRNVPPHFLAFSETPADWREEYAQEWDCYGAQFALHEYTFLQNIEYCRVKIRDRGEATGRYLFTAIPLNDGFSQEPAQSKEFKFIRCEDVERLTIQPTNRILFVDKSFTDKGAQWPSDLIPQTDVYTCE